MARSDKKQSIEDELENLQIDGEENQATQAVEDDPQASSKQEDPRFEPTEYTHLDQSDALAEIENSELHDIEDPDQVDPAKVQESLRGLDVKSQKTKYSKFYLAIFVVISIAVGILLWFLRDQILGKWSL